MRITGVTALIVSVCMLLSVAPSAAQAPAPAKPTLAKMPSFPASGPITVPTMIARAKPADSARRVAVIHQFRPDYREQYVMAIRGARDAHGDIWVQLRLQLRPNGTLGWVRASQLQLSTAHDKIIVHRGLRKIDMYSDGVLAYTAAVAIGAPGRETPLGNYYVTARFIPDDPFLGVFAVETSAYSKLTEWPGGGLVGIHGTSAPQLIGQAVSHGCVRVLNSTAVQLRRYAPLGTPISIVAN
jgi:lipoprotein-anchoring transpeptidase ErfK/SrfK